MFDNWRITHKEVAESKTPAYGGAGALMVRVCVLCF